jgi:glucose-6-phosphate-specific signal transduction histidine kinase
MRLKERFDAWVQRLVRESTLHHLRTDSELMYELTQRMDLLPLASLVATNDDLTRAVAEQLEDEIDTNDIAEKVAAKMDAEDVAQNIDMDDVCNNLDVSNYTDEIAEKVAAEIDVASCIDYDTLAEKLVEKLKEAWA